MINLQIFVVVGVLLHSHIATTISKSMKFEYKYHPLKNITKGDYHWRYRYFKNTFDLWHCGKRWEKLPAIKNLNQLLKPFANQKCLIDILNFQSVAIYKMEHPVILRHLTLGSLQFTRNSDGRIWKNNICFPSDIKAFTINNAEYMPPCPFSKLFDDVNCNQVSFNRFASNSKPWRCEVNVHLFQHEDAYKWILPMQDRIPESILYHERSLDPKLVFPITVFVDFSDKWKTITSENYEFWRRHHKNTQSRGHVNSNVIVQHIFMEMAIEKVLELKTPIQVLSANINKIYVLRSCKTITEGAITYKIELTLEIWEKTTAKELAEISSFPKNVEVFWGNTLDRKDGGFTEIGLYRHMAMCENEYRLAKSHSIKPFRENEEERIFHAYAYILQSIMGNYSYVMSQFIGKKCVNGKIQNENQDYYQIAAIDGLEVFWVTRGTALPSYQTGLTVNITLSSLQFVACGERGKTQFAFNELLVAYDITTWLFILSTVAALHFAFKHLWLPVSQFRHLLSLVKVLLEQGDPFLASVTQIPRLRWMVSSFLFIGIVLSNAYKNTNVYNMILPRNVLLFEYLHQLVDENITKSNIYARSVIYEHSKIWRDEDLWKYSQPSKYGFYTCFGHRFNIGEKWNLTFVESEIKGRFDIEKDFPEYGGKLRTDKYRWNMALELTQLQKNLVLSSQMHPRIPSLIGSFVETLTPIHQINYKGVSQYLRDYRKSFSGGFEKWLFDKEDKIIRDELLKCNQTAIVVPQYRARSYARQILKQNPTLPVSISKEIYLPFLIHAEVNGFVPLFIHRKIRSIQNSGVLDWWVKYIADNDRIPVSIPKPLESPTMSGSILVVFVLLLSGCGIGLVVFLIETMSTTVNKLYKFWKKIKLVSKYLYEYFNILKSCGIQWLLPERLAFR